MTNVICQITVSQLQYIFVRLWLSLLQLFYDKWQVLPRLNPLIGGDKDRPSNVNQEMLICAAWTEHEYFSCRRNCVNFCGGQIDLWHTMRLSCISAYFIIVVRRIRAAAIAVQKNGNSRKIIRLSSTITTITYHTYLKDCCWTPLHQIFLHTPCTTSRCLFPKWSQCSANSHFQSCFFLHRLLEITPLAAGKCMVLVCCGKM